MQTSTGSTVSNNTAVTNGGDGIQTGSGATVLGNSVHSNTGFGLNLASQSGYRENVITSNGAGTVSGASLVNLGNNACNGSTTCP
ncbi:MAG: right-handed parallel beta-helix repeat-containing protein [Deltaproteobacteria bacterium]|nr:right-handed parallel beta-helix repeat-containing protein [Deltaproteobacteria bacterium]